MSNIAQINEKFFRLRDSGEFEILKAKCRQFGLPEPKQLDVAAVGSFDELFTPRVPFAIAREILKNAAGLMIGAAQVNEFKIEADRIAVLWAFAHPNGTIQVNDEKFTQNANPTVEYVKPYSLKMQAKSGACYVLTPLRMYNLDITN